MAVISAQQAGGQPVVAFLDMLASHGVEATQDDPVTLDNGYDILVQGQPIWLNDGKQTPIPSGLVYSRGIHSRFQNSYADHPNVLVQVNPKLQSSAAGRYQIMTKWWPAYKKQLGLPDFSPLSQDKYAVQQLRERGAIVMLQQGRLLDAIKACSSVWASLPGNNYGQNQASVNLLIAAYNAAGGNFTA